MQRFTGHPASASAMSSIEFRNVGFRFKDSAVNLPLWPGGRSDLDFGEKLLRGIGLHRTMQLGRAVSVQQGVATKPHRPRLDCHNLHGVNWRGIPAAKLWRPSSDSGH